MPALHVDVVRLPHRFVADSKRVITRPFFPGDDSRLRRIVGRVLDLPEDRVREEFGWVEREFSQRHRDIRDDFEENFQQVAFCLDPGNDISEERRLLIGAYFTMEYSIESAALFNPSIVAHPDQSGMPAGATRFIMSLRATGEGHVSSIAFRTGLVDANNEIHFDPTSRYVQRAKQVKNRVHNKHNFYLKLIEMGGFDGVAMRVMASLAESFTFTDLLAAIETARASCAAGASFDESAGVMRWLARSNYHLKFPADCALSEVVIFPTSESESRGIEDARFTRFVGTDGEVIYYATYTAYDGVRVLPQLLETTDFSEFRITTLNGKFVQNKGLALFPRRIDDMYMMVSRFDGENLFIMPSDNIRFWNEATPIKEPKHPWEFVQIGNCGPPLETEKGWLLLTHGVGPMRRYCIGAVLLDLENPYREIGYLPEPLIIPNADEREGYVPNVVYSCGAIIHDSIVILPYGISDSATTVAKVSLPELLDCMMR